MLSVRNQYTRNLAPWGGIAQAKIEAEIRERALIQVSQKLCWGYTNVVRLSNQVDMMPRHLTATRRDILNTLKKRGELTATELAECLGMTSVAVRHQLTHLQAADLVEQHVTRRPVGRPVAVYVLSPVADELFPKQYEDLATSILNQIAELDGEERISQIFHLRAAKLEAEYRSKLAGKNLGEKVARLAELLTEDDAMAECVPVGDGYELHMYNCVLSRVVDVFPQVCAEEMAMFERILDADVSRTEHVPSGDRRCVYLITPRPIRD